MYNLLKKGIFFNAIGNYSIVIVNLIVNAILARILTPDEYGIVAIVQVFIVFFQLIAEAGMGPAIIQNKELEEDDYSSLFNFSFIFAAILAVSFGMFGYVIASIYDNEILISLSWIQTIAIFFNSFAVVPLAMLNKDKKFKSVNFVRIISSVVSGIVGIVSAFMGAGVYALIYSAIALALVKFILIFYLSKIKITSSFNLNPLKKILGFSVNQFGFNFINYFARNTDNLLVGRFMGPSALGNYNKAYQLLMMPNSMLLSIITPVLQPVLSEYQNDIPFIRKTYLQVVKVLAFIGVPLSVFLSIFSSEIIEFLFGNQWADAVLPFRILSLTVWVQMTLSSTGAIFQARNKSRELMVTGVISTIIITSSTIIGVLLGDLVSLAICLSVGFLLNFCMSFDRLMRLVLDSKLSQLINVFLRPFLVGGVVSIGLFVTKNIHINNLFLFLLFQGIVFVILFMSSLFLLGEMKLMKQVFKR